MASVRFLNPDRQIGSNSRPVIVDASPDLLCSTVAVYVLAPSGQAEECYLFLV